MKWTSVSLFYFVNYGYTANGRDRTVCMFRGGFVDNKSDFTYNIVRNSSVVVYHSLLSVT